MPVVDKNFAIVGDDGSIRYPYKKGERASRRYGFAISKPGGRDARGDAEYTDDLALVVGESFWTDGKFAHRPWTAPRRGPLELGRSGPTSTGSHRFLDR